MRFLKLFPITLLLIFAGCLDNPNTSYDDSEDQAFIEEYSQRDDVTTTSSGLMYRVIEEGEGEKPTATSIVLADMEGSSIDGEQSINTFDGDHPSILALKDNLPGYQEGFQLMNIGSLYEMVFPTNLAFGDGRVIHFERIKLLNTQTGFIEEYTQQEDVTTTDSGLRYRVIEEGEGESPNETSTIVVNYTGTLMNGVEFDSGESSTFTVDGVIDGFAEGLQLMNTGSTYEFLIPADIGYGDDSPGYPGAVLLFEVELLEIQ
ncbi:MAG: FKBP-type peptidyl-prolyl cis-trans isomerase [Balneolaceae bacterium]|nr:FKBP-type peptidyl-prolyl cis-trans isomerase [Balneolaceae bacterium]